MPMDKDPIFTQAPPEVTRYFEQKGNHPSFDWRDVAPIEHALDFTVAKTAGFDVLSDLRSATDEAIRHQLSFEEFRASIEPTLRKKGWWGRKIAKDPHDNQPKIVQLGSIHRLRTIHWANVTTARAAGEWERIQRTKKFLPFLRYTISSSERRRPQHTSWVGTILPADHAWWVTHYPPNGWLCKCGIRQITRRQAERDGYDPDDPAPVIDAKPWTNKRTGETFMVPGGIDPGWQSNPGINRMRTIMRSFGERLREMPIDQARLAISNYWSGNEAKAHLAFNERVHMPVAISKRAQEFFSSPAPTITISSDTFMMKSGKHAPLNRDLMINADQLIANGEWHKGSTADTIDVFVESDNQLWKFVIKTSADKFLYLRTVFPTTRKRILHPKL